MGENVDPLQSFTFMLDVAGLKGYFTSVDGLGSECAADSEGDDDEREPAERGGLPVAGAPATHAGREVPLGVVGAGHGSSCRVGGHLPTTLGAGPRAVVVTEPDPGSDQPTIFASDLRMRRHPRGWRTLGAWDASAL